LGRGRARELPGFPATQIIHGAPRALLSSRSGYVEAIPVPPVMGAGLAGCHGHEVSVSALLSAILFGSLAA